jgi:hypothetical protein
MRADMGKPRVSAPWKGIEAITPMAAMSNGRSTRRD